MSNEESLGRRGAQTPNSTTSDTNAQSFLVRQILATLSTSKVVKIIAVTNDGALSPVGFVDVQPMVTQLDGDGQPFPHSVIFNIPYFRLQGGTDAVIIDPKVGDIGICVFSDRDISTVKETRDIAKPGSMRSFSAADGIYIGGILNGEPTQFVRFYDGGIEIVSPDSFTVTTPNSTVNSDYIQMNGNMDVSGNLTVGNGASGTFTTREGLVVTVQDGIVTNIF